jgi:hypothetical protein
VIVGEVSQTELGTGIEHHAEKAIVEVVGLTRHELLTRCGAAWADGFGSFKPNVTHTTAIPAKMI